MGRQRFGVFIRIHGMPDAVRLAEVGGMPHDLELPAMGAAVSGVVIWSATTSDGSATNRGGERQVAAARGDTEETESASVAGEEAAARVVAQFADHVHWVWEWPDKPTWRDRLRRLVSPESYRFEPSAPPAKPWVDRPAGHYERTGWRIRAAYYRSDLAFEVEYVVCDQCRIGWVESPYTYEGYKRCGVASAALRSLRRAYPGLQWHTGGGHFRESAPFWDSVSVDVPGGYAQQERCHHVEPRRAR